MAKATGELAMPSNVGGIHFHSSKTVNMAISIDNDNEIAQLVYEATRGFDPVELGRLKLLAEASDPLLIEKTPAAAKTIYCK